MGGKVIVMAPGRVATVVDHEGAVQLGDLYRLIGCEAVDYRRLGQLPTGRWVDMWFDDEGLLNDAPANRELPDGRIIAGTILICGADGPENVPLHVLESDLVMATVTAWRILPDGHPKPEPRMEFITLE